MGSRGNRSAQRGAAKQSGTEWNGDEGGTERNGDESKTEWDGETE